MKKRLGWLLALIVALALTLTGCAKKVSQLVGPAGLNGTHPAPLMLKPAGPHTVKDQYIVVLKGTADVDREADQLGRQLGFSTRFRYRHAIKGFAAAMPLAMAEALRNSPNVQYVEQDQIVHAVATESAPTWGIDRVDQRALPLSNSYSYGLTGAGVDVYCIDTGIRFSHVDFGGRAVTGVDEITPGGNAADGNGHGTHTAGTIGGATYGVAKGVRLIAVRVLDNLGYGTSSQVIAGVDWVTGNHTTTPAVANMSLGGPVSTAVDDAVRNSIADGVTYCVSAGNSQADVSTQSPADVAEAITVGATDINDAFAASFSNFGAGEDLCAPGVNVTSDWFSSNTATAILNGTSMASPHVAGIAALYLAANPTATPAQVQSAITSNATNGVISGIPAGTPNKLAYVLASPKVSAGTSTTLDAYFAPYPYTLPGTLVPSNIVKVDIAGSNGHVYAWYTNGTASSGTSEDFTAYAAPYPYTLPAGYAISDIVGIAIASSNDHVYAWYRNGFASSGTTDHLDAYIAPFSYTLPPGYTTNDIVDMAINSQDRIYTWYKNGMMSIGNSGKLDYYAAPTPYTPAAGYAVSNIIGIGIVRATSKVYAWYSY